jgi:lipoate-protein ligase A
MAVDVALMRRARQTGEAVFRVYSWSAPTLSFGRNQTAMGRYNLDRIRAMGVDVVRRPTGGRAILHWREVTYSVTAPASDGIGVKQSYTRINQILLDGLGRLGVAVEVATPTARTHRPTDAPCFVTPSEGEMTTNGQKLVGSAQWRDGDALLQHGSILVEDDQTLLASLMVHPPPEGSTRVGTLHEALGRKPEPEEIAAAMFQAVRGREDPVAAQLDVGDVIRLGEESTALFLDDRWTWRR